MNIILRRCLNMLNLTLLKRDYFDPAMAQDIPVVNIFLSYIHFYQS